MEYCHESQLLESSTPYTDAIRVSSWNYKIEKFVICYFFQRKRPCQPHIKRPLNPFMVWSQIERQKLISSQPGKCHCKMEILAAFRWSKNRIKNNWLEGILKCFWIWLLIISRPIKQAEKLKSQMQMQMKIPKTTKMAKCYPKYYQESRTLSEKVSFWPSKFPWCIRYLKNWEILILVLK